MASDDDEIPETGAIFTFGKTRFAENLANKFWIRDDKVLQLDCGDEHSAVITSSGRLYTFGSNDWGQLGHGNTKPYTKPGVVKKLKGDRVKAVACGRSHTLVISESGVFSFGAGADSQLGHGDNQSYNVPTEIEALNDKTITQVSCGAEHSAALAENGELYVWGSGSEGQLGLGIAECEVPSLLKFRSKVAFVACGYYHTAVITELGKLYTFGDNEAGKLGLEDNQCEDTEEPQQVKTLNEPAVFVACGGNHTAVLTKRGSLFTFGSGMHGQLGHGPAFQDIALPKLVSTLQGKFASTVSCGESHTAVLTKNGEMYSFGDGRHGKLGMGDESFSNLFQPTKVKRFKKFDVEQVSCGGCHMLAVAARRQNDIQDSEGSEQEVSRVEEDSGGEDVPDGPRGPRLSQTVPMSGMSARDKRRKKDTEGTALASSLPPLNRSLPPLASLGLATMKKEENKPVSNGRLNPLDRSTLPIISIKSPSPDDEENTSERLANSRRLPPRPKRRQKKIETSSDSEEGGRQRESTTSRPTPLPRKQKIMTENENNEENVKKSRKDQKGRESVKKSGSEASDEDSENDDDNDEASSHSSLRRMSEAKVSKISEASHTKDEDITEDESEDDDEGSEEEDGRDNREKEIRKSGKEERKRQEDGKKERVKEDKKEMQEDEENDDDTEGGEEESEEENDDDDVKDKGKKINHCITLSGGGCCDTVVAY
ncbi:Hypothetical predicted protein [Paramuricea clavata]|uniref:X-linked retinitis pigmentosa GTPase regulator n=1 Tax=Paramuricea clavata TaxID=317549 RepID=A0A6S7HXI8_PARCT|nr:Hypothetical predicted protein [Paramuricea clavata]